MNSINTLLQAYICEFKKSKNSSAFWMSFVGVLSVVGIFFLIRIIKYEHFIPKQGMNPWDSLIKDNMNIIGALFLPFFVVLLTTLFVQIEHRTNLWKHLKVLPFHFSAIYYGKILAIVTYIVGTHLFFIVMLLLSGLISGLIHPELLFLKFQPDILLVIKLVSQYVISSLGILIIQYWISMRTKSFIIPIGIGLVNVIATLILIHGWEDIIYYPYAYSALVTMIESGKVSIDNIFGLPNISVYSVMYFTVLSIISYFDLKRIEVK